MISIFSTFSRRQRVIIRNRAERVSELLDWKTLGRVSIQKLKFMTFRNFNNVGRDNMKVGVIT